MDIIYRNTQAILAPGQFKVTPKTKGNGCHTRRTNTVPPNNDRLDGIGRPAQTGVTQPAESPSAVVVGTSRTKASRHPERHRRTTSITRRAMNNINLYIAAMLW
jgi:hypothetical protein